MTDRQLTQWKSCLISGMMIESMAGKSAAMHGLCHDATPFTFTEEEPPIDYFGRLLSEGRVSTSETWFKSQASYAIVQCLASVC